MEEMLLLGEAAVRSDIHTQQEDSHLVPCLPPKVFVSDGRKCRHNNDFSLILTSQLRCGAP